MQIKGWTHCQNHVQLTISMISHKLSRLDENPRSDRTIEYLFTSATRLSRKKFIFLSIDASVPNSLSMRSLHRYTEDTQRLPARISSTK